MIPLVGTKEEFENLKEGGPDGRRKVSQETGDEISYHVGTMIEIPRAALTADEIAEDAEFFSFGTNDLTQMTFGFSRDDTGKFLPAYLAKGSCPTIRSQTLDQPGVGELVEMASRRAAERSPDLKVGICGEHGGDPESIGFFHQVGLDYVSCSPFPGADRPPRRGARRDRGTRRPRAREVTPATAGRDGRRASLRGRSGAVMPSGG